MVKILSLLVLCIALFVGGLAASLYLRPSANAEAEGAAATGATANGDGAENETKAPELPVAFHGGPMSSDEIFRFTAAVRARERELKLRQEELENRESRLKMVEQDLRRQRQEMDGVMQQLQDTLEMSTKKLEQVKLERKQLEAERAKAINNLQQAKKFEEEMSANEAAQVRRLAQLLEGLPEDRAAEMLVEMANSGKMEDAVQLLVHVEARNAAKILGEIKDTALLVQLTEAYRALQPPAPK